MSTELHCKRCCTLLALLRDAKVRNDIVTYCAPCDRELHEMIVENARKNDVPEFLQSFMGGFKGKRHG